MDRLGAFGMTLIFIFGSFWSHCGITLESFWKNLWDRYWIILESFSGSQWGNHTGYFGTAVGLVATQEFHDPDLLGVAGVLLGLQ